MRVLDNIGNEYNIVEKDCLYTIKKEEIPHGLEYIDVINEDFFSVESEDGYYVIADWFKTGSRLCYFNHKEDMERIYRQTLMPVYGVKNKKGCTLVIVEGFKHEFFLVTGVKDKNYYIYPRFVLNGSAPYEDIKLRFIKLDDISGYNEMAAAYREYQLKNGNCRPLLDKMKERKELDYAVKAPEIRVRLGWKPAPTKVLFQTPKNEPEMKVACTFDRVCDMIDELKKQGVDKAQICLVGWNKSGHDGRYPQIFPVEEKLGGEERLRHLVRYAQKNGYSIVCHTNSTDCYSIAEDFSEGIVIKNKDGSLSINCDEWSGGRMYNLCPVKALEFAQRDLPKISEIGFRGLHYIDVLSVVPLKVCHDVHHPSGKNETLEYYNSIMKLCHEYFGGFASEGVYDFTSKYLDYGLYVASPGKKDDMVDCEIPFWELVYHGMVLYNITPDTVNYPIKSAKNHLKVIEYGGRPAFYFYSKHREGSKGDNWLGEVDMLCDTDEQLKFNVSKIKEAYDEYKSLMHLQTEFIESHKEVEENVFEVRYSNGEVLKIDYNKMDYELLK